MASLGHSELTEMMGYQNNSLNNCPQTTCPMVLRIWQRWFPITVCATLWPSLACIEPQTFMCKFSLIILQNVSMRVQIITMQPNLRHNMIYISMLWISVLKITQNTVRNKLFALQRTDILQSNNYTCHNSAYSIIFHVDCIYQSSDKT